MSHTYPRSFSHIGISVPNVEKAVEFYTQVMGWYLYGANRNTRRQKPNRRNVY